MKKFFKILIIVVLLLLLLIVYMCNRTYKYEFDSDISFFEDKDVTIDISAITPTGAKILITDNSEYGYYWGGFDSRLQKKQGNDWKYVRSKLKQHIILAVAQGRDENNEFSVNCNWLENYGKLKQGTYRFIIKASYPKAFDYKYFCSPEFVIKKEDIKNNNTKKVQKTKKSDDESTIFMHNRLTNEITEVDMNNIKK